MSSVGRTVQRRPLERTFIKSVYLTLALAATALSWSLRDLVPAVPLVSAIVAFLILVAYVLERRWALSIPAANFVGTAIAVAVGIWFIRESLRASRGGTLANMPWPTSLVPLLGPVLLVLIPAKLLRPKSTADYWGLHLIALACVGLGCAMTDDALFGLLLLLYVASALWSLSLFFLHRENQGTTGSPREVGTPGWPQLLSWLAPVLLVALIGFLTLPRSQATWQIPTAEGKLESGAPEEAKLDLHRTGELSLDNEVVLEVKAAYRDGRPKNDLPADQRWRGQVFRHYDKGEWQRAPRGSSTPQQPRAVATADMPREVTLPDFGRPDQYYLTYFVRAPLGPAPVVSDPVYRPGNAIPVVTLYPDGRLGAWSSDLEGTLRIREKVVPGKTRYWQVTVPPPAPDISHPVELNPMMTELRRPPDLPELTAWTESLLRRLVSEGQLSAAAIEDRSADGTINPIRYYEVAKALEAYLSTSGEYVYSLTLERRHPSIDPTLDFLFHTRSGHCTRFASALALMLRALQIPCQVVTGFRGVDRDGDGSYTVRQCHAHTWVEALIFVQQPAPPHGMHHGDENWHWLTLDPTPSEAAVEATAASSRFFGFDLDPKKLYRNLIVGFTPENRDEFFNDVGKAARTAWQTFRREIFAATPQGFRLRIAVALALAVMVAAGWLALRWLKARLIRWGVWSAPDAKSRFYADTLRILARHGLKPLPAQTPREFVDQIAREWASRPNVVEIVGLASQNAELYYRERFGCQAASRDELRQAHDRVRQLRRALRPHVEFSAVPRYNDAETPTRLGDS